MNNKETYRNWVKGQEVPLFYQPWYLDTVCTEGEWDVAIGRYGENLAGYWPYYLKQKYSLRYLTQPHLTPYLGPQLLVPEHIEKTSSIISIQKKLIAQLEEQIPKTTLSIVHAHPSYDHWHGLFERGYHQTTRYTYRLLLDQDLPILRTNLDAKVRNQIKKIEASWEVISLDEGSGEVYDLFAHSFGRQGVAIPFSGDFFEHYDKRVKEHDARQIFGIRDERGQLLSMVYIVYDHDTAYLMLTGRRGEDVGPMVSALIWHAIVWSKERGLKVFDFEGSMISSIERFFRSFGGHPTPYHRITKTSNRWTYALFHLMNRV